MESQIKNPVWRFIVRRVGGLHDFGKLSIGIFDQGFMFAWNRIVKFEIPRRS